MLPLFSTAWSDLDLDAVAGFLADAEEEGVTWEAKADDQRGRLHPDSLRKAACGLANRVGGYILIGAKWDKAAKRWELPGITRPDTEPELWVGKVLRGLRPTPVYETRAWTLADDRIAAVVWIAPVDEPPCMTPHGQVYERVSSETIPVTDPARLDALFRGGQHARARAEHFANRAANRALDAPRWHSDRAVGIAVALAPVGRKTDDLGSQLFIESFGSSMVDALQMFVRIGHPERSRVAPNRWERWQQQDALSLFAHFEQGGLFEPGGTGRRPSSTWYLQATWDGAVVAAVALSPEAVGDLTDLGEVLTPAWKVIVPLAERLGGYGPAHLAAGVYAAPDLPRSMPLVRDGVAIQRPPPPPKGTLFAALPERTLMGRCVSIGAAASDVLSSMDRELRRAGGRETWEPDATPS